MSIATALNRLSAAKTAIANAIKGKGVSVSSSAGFEDFAGLISSISQEGGSSGSGSGGGATISDMVVYTNDFDFASASSTPLVLISQSELVSLGIIPDTNSLITSVWSKFLIDFRCISNSGHASYMILHAMAHEGFGRTSSSTYYRELMHHGGSASSVSLSGTSTTMTTSTAGYLYNTTAGGLQIVANSSYKVAATSYRLTFIGLEKI